MRSVRSSMAKAWVRSSVADRAWLVLREFSCVGDLLLRRLNLSLLSFPCFMDDMLDGNLNQRRSFVLDMCQSRKLHLRREGESKSEREEKRKNKEKGERKENIK